MISLLCPTRGRPKLVKHMLTTATLFCTEPFQAVFWVDDDDHDTYHELRQWDNHPRCTVHIILAPRGSVAMSDMWNQCAYTALKHRPKWPLLFIDDEAAFVTFGWDRLFLIELRRIPDGALLVHPADLVHGGAAAGYFAVAPTWVEIFGRLTPPMFTYGYADVWCMEVAAAVGRNFYVPGIVIENLAPRLQPPDQTHQDNHARAVRDRPGDLYNATQPQRERDVEILKDWIDRHHGTDYNWATR